eukprot:TRINITY_DN1451_c0_g1_i2.p1 TRINITY_DN1451_c0_g1~~TRINITY_DN1451_c0_g1_i2.p1  ORF type:complete len:195 (-),score=47.71 TRINITY_DN1451_c0_g1_i2:199-783(-)
MSSYKIVVIGPGGVGKSCFTIQLISGTFVESYDPTLEDSYRKRMTIDGQEAILNIYDTAGQEDFSAVRDTYIQIGEGFLCMYSITSNASFQEVRHLRERIINITDKDNIPVVLCGNKADLPDEREVATTTGEALAKEFGWGFLEGSAKTKTNVVEAFEEVTRRIRKHKDPEVRPVEVIKNTKKRGGGGGLCVVL